MIKILHNDTCPICSREVASYVALARDNDIEFTVDGLDNAGAWGLDEDTAAQVFRVQKDGVTYEGFAAFRVLWAQLPYWRHVAWITGLGGIRPLGELGYKYAAAPFLYGMHKRRIKQAHRASR
jgi:predicted DCC family thiol-disulfide oxidoreductase YuxK